MSARAPISVVLGDMLTAAGTEHLTLDWLLGRMGGRSFGLVLLLLSIFGLLPGVSAFAAVLLMIPAIQMLLARSGPVFLRRLRSRRFEARRLEALLRYVVPALRWLERFVRRRWRHRSRRPSALWGVLLLLRCHEQRASRARDHADRILAYLEEDGALLCGALAIALVIAAAVLLGAWETMSAVGWVPGLL